MAWSKQTQRIYENVALLALGSSCPHRSHAGSMQAPLFSGALHALMLMPAEAWLSMMAAVGLAFASTRAPGIPHKAA